MLAFRLQGGLPGNTPTEHLVQAGMLGLLDALGAKTAGAHVHAGFDEAGFVEVAVGGEGVEQGINRRLTGYFCFPSFGIGFAVTG